jgi:hypothetical protein
VGGFSKQKHATKHAKFVDAFGRGDKKDFRTKNDKTFCKFVTKAFGDSLFLVVVEGSP